MDGRFDTGSLGVFLPVWVVMMAAMMFPSVWPSVLVHRRVLMGRRRAGRVSGGSTTAFMGGYLASWGTYGVAAFALLVVASAAFGGLSDSEAARYVVAPAALIGAGYQVTPLKVACLRHCQGPLAFFVRHWRDGLAGSFRLGFRHGGYCVGCCWAEMLFLLSVGVMSLAWMVIVAAAIAVEKFSWKARTWVRYGLAAALIAIAALAALDPSTLPGFGGNSMSM
jgi:predicted metal-binding membrane protein